jgi:cytochrome c biogenesis protein ResB
MKSLEFFLWIIFVIVVAFVTCSLVKELIELGREIHKKNRRENIYKMQGTSEEEKQYEYMTELVEHINLAKESSKICIRPMEKDLSVVEIYLEENSHTCKLAEGFNFDIIEVLEALVRFHYA